MAPLHPTFENVSREMKILAYRASEAKPIDCIKSLDHHAAVFTLPVMYVFAFVRCLTVFSANSMKNDSHFFVLSLL